jgi:hypothetical protein
MFGLVEFWAQRTVSLVDGLAGWRVVDDDVSITTDGRRLDSKEAVLEFLAEVEEARAQGRSLDPHDRRP